MKTLTDAKSRDIAPDVLRGFALFGILVVNITSFAFGEIGLTGPLTAGTVNHISEFILVLFFQSKFFLIFSFLFGYSSNYIVKDEKRNLIRWIKRCFLLMILGLLHQQIWGGDILLTYGILGLLLLPFLLLKVKTLKIWVITFYLIFALPLSAEVFKAGAGLFLQGGFSFIAFLAGLTASKTQALKQGVEILNTRMMMWVGFTIGLSIQASLAYLFMHSFRDPDTNSWSFIFFIVAFFAASPILSMGYVGAILQIVRSGNWLVSQLRFAGRMSLTSYLMQSIIMKFIFSNWGFNLNLKLDLWIVLLMTIPIYVSQILISRLWFTRFNQGPVEKIVNLLTVSKPN